MLLDEIDGPLDSDNREKFIKILENYLITVSEILNQLTFLKMMIGSMTTTIML